MKALVIADNEKVIKRINSTLESFGYDTIVYRWLLKALDNIEEISPHLIVISTEDYPRHWKTLTQFAEWTQNAENSETADSFDVIQFPQVILMVGDNFSAEEEDKAKTLRVVGTFKKVDEDGEDGNYSKLGAILDSLSKKFGTAKKKEDDTPLSFNEPVLPPTEQSETESNEEESGVTVPCSFVFTNPITLSLVYGTARNFNGKTLEFTPDIPDFAKTLSEGTTINSASLRITSDDEHSATESIKSVTAIVASKDSDKLVIKITA